MSNLLSPSRKLAECDEAEGPVEMVIRPRRRDLGEFSVRRVLPAGRRRMVGPYIFFDHMGPVTFEPGKGVAVRPHPHIGIATVTYLFEGEIIHRDSLGYTQAIRPGAVNLMVAGKGVVHSERTAPEESAKGPPLHGIQLWLALPVEKEEMEPGFTHYPADSIPAVQVDDARVAVIIGGAYGETSPVATQSPTLYAEARFGKAGGELDLPGTYTDRAVYLAEGAARIGGQPLEAGEMAVITSGIPTALTADGAARAMIIGGEPFAEERHIWWNLVSSRPQRIEQAKADWKEGRFDPVPGDDEFIPLPEE